MAQFIVIMRAWDPVGGQYKHWQSSGFDVGGTDYAGPPAFGTLQGVCAIKIVPVAIPPGYSAWLPIYDPTQLIAQSTENLVQLDRTQRDVYGTLYEGGSSYGEPFPVVPTAEHPVVNTEWQVETPAESIATGLNMHPVSLQQFEAI